MGGGEEQEKSTNRKMRKGGGENRSRDVWKSQRTILLTISLKKKNKKPITES